MAAHASDNTRRRYPRLDVLGRIEGQVLALDARLHLRDLSLGGFSVDSNRPFAPCQQYAFRFTTAGRVVVELDAISVHCRIGSVGSDSRLTYVAGFEWTDAPENQEKIASLVEVLAPVLARG